MTTVRVALATAERWPQLGWVFGPREKDPTSCWCQRFRRHEEPDNRAALEREVHEADLPVGLLAHLDDDVVGVLATPLTPTGSPAPRHPLASSPELSPSFGGPGSPRSDAPTQPDP